MKAPAGGAPLRGLRPMSRSFSLLSLLVLALCTPAVHAETPAPEVPSEAPAEPPETPTPVPGGLLPDTPQGPRPVPAPTELPAPTPKEAVPEHRGVDVPSRPVIRVEHHGLFRFRPELLVGADLGPGISGVPAPLGLTTGQDPDAAALAWASVRLRYEPTLFVGSSVELHLGLDALDDLVLGSTHGAVGSGLAVDVLGESQAPPSSGSFGWRDALGVRQAWMRWLAFDMVDVRAGRMADHYGLGIARNDGACEDCDFGTIVDGVSAGFSITGFRIEAAWEYTAVGATSDLVFAQDRGAGGQPKDLGQEDDVSTYRIEVGSYPVTAVELRERARVLDEAREWALDWSLFSTFTDQPLSSSEQIDGASVECLPEGELANGQPLQPYDCVRLFRRGAFFWRPGLWLRAEVRPAMDESLRIEREAAGLFGEVAHPQRLLDARDEEAKTFQGFGLAAELEWRRGALGLGLDLGLATGDDGEHIGVLDGQDVVDPDDDAYATNDALRDNGTIGSFVFNRDYHLDLLLFRQVIGAVTNAAYFKPWVASEVLRSEDMTLTLRLDVLYALAMRPSGTPGDGDHWGLELDARAILDLAGGFRATVAAGVLMPLSALDDPDTGEGGDPAGAVRALFGWTF